VAGLFASDLDVGELFLDDLLNPIGTAVGGFIAQLTDQDGQVALAAHGFAQFLFIEIVPEAPATSDS
jgi:hypothetical protein